MSDEMNPPEIIDKNDLWVTFGIVPFRFATDDAYIFWSDSEVRHQYNWAINEYGELVMLGEKEIY
jgi:hypothetical protein